MLSSDSENKDCWSCLCDNNYSQSLISDLNNPDPGSFESNNVCNNYHQQEQQQTQSLTSPAGFVRQTSQINYKKKRNLKWRSTRRLLFRARKRLIIQTGLANHRASRSLSSIHNQADYDSTKQSNHQVSYTILQPGIPTVGDGVRIIYEGQSLGYGLQAMKKFNKGQIITQYCGRVVTLKQAMSLHNQDKLLTTHAASHRSRGEVILGIQDPSQAIGNGGGSFVNHSFDKSIINCKFGRKENGLFLIATKEIEKHDIIYCNYGKSFLSSRLTNISSTNEE